MNPALKTVAEALLPNPMLYRLRARRAKARGDNPELALLPKFNHGGIMLDIGANIGDYSRVACLIFRNVVAFEPNPSLVQKLRAELPGNVTVFDTALSDAPGRSALYVPVRNGQPVTGLASLDPHLHHLGIAEEITVDIRTLDSFGLSDIDLIKIDVEGLEESVLKGARDTLRRNTPSLIVEIEDRHHPGKTLPVFQLLDEMGFDVHYYSDGQLCPVDLSGDVNQSPAGEYVNNFVCLHRARTINV
jgi:FkbM family methyltransferase